jgi:CRP-like cAMP-binding protein
MPSSPAWSTTRPRAGTIPVVPAAGDDPRANRLLAALDPGDYRELAPHLRVVRLRCGKALLEAGEEARHVWFPHDCLVSLVSVLGDGRTAETGTIGREGVLGFVSALGDSRPVVHGVVRVTGTASRVERARFNGVFEARPGVRRLCLRYAGALVAQVLQSVACNAYHPVEARLARWLLTFQDRTGGGALPLTHEILAEMLAVQRSTLTPAAQALQEAGLIRYRRGVVEVLDRAGLERASCECYDVVRDQFERLLPAAPRGGRPALL